MSEIRFQWERAPKWDGYSACHMAYLYGWKNVSSGKIVLTKDRDTPPGSPADPLFGVTAEAVSL